MARSGPFERSLQRDYRGVRSPPVSLVVNLYPSENDLDLEQQDFQMPGSAYLVDRPSRPDLTLLKDRPL